MIPAVIHYCWFGDKPEDEAALGYIAGWKKILPGYDFRKWTNADLKDIKNKYVSEAYSMRKWAFVSDYVRLYALYKYGGIYLDTDVEVKKSFDPFLGLDFFCGSEKYKKAKQAGTAVIGSCRNSPVTWALLKVYDNISFIKEDGSADLTPNTKRLAEPLLKLGFSALYTEKEPLYCGDKNVIFPVNYFSEEAPGSYAVHHFCGSWHDDFKIKNKIKLKYGKKTFRLLKVRRLKPGAVFSLPDKHIISGGAENKRVFWLLTSEENKK